MEKADVRSVLFLCTGNYYRSRFAEVLFNALAAKHGLSWRATSRGLALERGVLNIGPMAVAAIEALQRLRVAPGDACSRMPIQATAEAFAQADRIIALKQGEHLPLLRERFPEWAAKVEFWQVEDAPEALAVIEREVAGLIARLQESDHQSGG